MKLKYKIIDIINNLTRWIIVPHSSFVFCKVLFSCEDTIKIALCKYIIYNALIVVTGQFIIREIPFYRRLLLLILRLWYFHFRHASSNRLPLHSPTSTLLVITLTNKEGKIAVQTLTIARHVMYLEDPGIKTPESERVVIFLSRGRISIKIGVIDRRIFPLDSIKTTLFKRLWTVGDITTRNLRYKCDDYIIRFRI